MANRGFRYSTGKIRPIVSIHSRVLFLADFATISAYQTGKSPDVGGGGEEPNGTIGH